MTSFLTSLLLLAFALFSTVASAPLLVRDVYVPPVLYPSTGVVWSIGARHNVTWDASNQPTQITNKIGRIVLAKAGILDLDHPLADNFDIVHNSRIEVTVPNVVPGDDYQIILFGDSGNSGGFFTISA